MFPKHHTVSPYIPIEYNNAYRGQIWYKIAILQLIDAKNHRETFL